MAVASWLFTKQTLLGFLCLMAIGSMWREKMMASNNPYPQRVNLVEEARGGVYKSHRHMYGFGRAAYSYVVSGAYRTGAGSFAVIGLGSKPLFSYGNPELQCEWNSKNMTLTGSAKMYFPDWGFGRVYTTVITHCDFGEEQAIHTQAGGDLNFILKYGSGASFEQESVVALHEDPGDFKESDYPGGKGFEYKYDYLYCGSSLFGDIDPARLKQWLAYHTMLFGPKSHFVLHDAGAIKSHPENQKVLEPWVKAGVVTVHDFTEQDRYDSWYHNQFLVVNDCLLRHKHAAPWTFLFDVDEYIHVPPPNTIKSVLDRYGEDYTQIMFQQNLMGPDVCLADQNRTDKWEFEKLVFKDVTEKWRKDRKYVIKAALAHTAGVHLSQHIEGKGLYEEKGLIDYYHFHNTITKHNDVCTKFIELPEDHQKWVKMAKNWYVYDDKLASLAQAAKEYERKVIGNQQP